MATYTEKIGVLSPQTHEVVDYTVEYTQPRINHAVGVVMTWLSYVASRPLRWLDDRLGGIQHRRVCDDDCGRSWDQDGTEHPRCVRVPWDIKLVIRAYFTRERRKRVVREYPTEA